MVPLKVTLLTQAIIRLLSRAYRHWFLNHVFCVAPIMVEVVRSERRSKRMKRTLPMVNAW